MSNIDNASGKTGAKVRSGLAVLAAACGIALTSVATAADPFAEPLTKVVNYADLDLNRQPGAETLYRRLRLAAGDVCQPSEGRTLKTIGDWRACFDQAIARAVEQIDKPALTAYHLARTGKVETPVAIARK